MSYASCSKLFQEDGQIPVWRNPHGVKSPTFQQMAVQGGGDCVGVSSAEFSKDHEYKSSQI